MHYACMVTITIRGVPDETHAELVARAASARQSLQEYLLSELTKLAQKPDIETLMARVRERKASYRTRLSANEIIGYRDSDRK